MWSNLVVLHSESKLRDQEEFEGLHHWKTCMRTIYVGDSRLFDTGSFPFETSVYQLHIGFDAYKVLLEIVSGLKSRLLGETEVLSQFKEVFKNENLPDSALGEYLRKLRDRLIEDSRKLRSEYLRNLGDQSYGGLAYRNLKGRKSVAMIGTGQLAEKMIPWVLKDARDSFVIVGRNREKLEELGRKFNVPVKLLSEYVPEEEAVVVAAPVSVQEIGKSLKAGSMVVDFREDPLGDSFSEDIIFISFESMLQSLKENEERNNKLRAELETVVESIVDDREAQLHHNNIYGWEDIPCLSQ